jgi:hypothetical protein
MSEKVSKMLRRATNGTTITKGGMHALKRAYYATPRKERARFSVGDTVRALQLRELKRNIILQAQAAAGAEFAAAFRRRRRRRGVFGKLMNAVLQLGRLGRR